ncbi:MAG: 3D domain-containing protein [Candidatus Velthaea sp.]
MAATSVFSLALLLPLGAGSVSDRAAAVLQSVAAQAPTKHVTFVRSGDASAVGTRAATVGDFLQERGVVPSAEDAVSLDPGAALQDGDVVEYRPAVPVTLVVDGLTRAVLSPASTVAQVLAEQHVEIGAHDQVLPAAGSSPARDAVIRVTHVTAWTERLRAPIAPAVKRRYDIALAPGTTRVLDRGSPGARETTVLVSQPDRSLAPRRSLLASRVVRAPRTRVIALGIGEYAAFSHLAHRGMQGTLHLAGAALNMVATAYSSQCVGCSGFTRIGRRAGHGIVAVDPHVIPLGTRLFIPGYGRALAGDTGGAIRGKRIDLGFDSHGDALTFGRRQVVVYVLK